ncbi:THAP domain-containing protein 5-like isoform X3 [Ornithodoros turicata]|uniref:THAP domain-containing protein 5-like isoform X3 n=1 Tax=Ornithodoros turicata TaxID=34597 RepID=UPI0031391DE7
MKSCFCVSDKEVLRNDVAPIDNPLRDTLGGLAIAVIIISPLPAACQENTAHARVPLSLARSARFRTGWKTDAISPLPRVMPTNCVAFGCTNYFVQGKKLRFFRFPSGNLYPEKREAWIRAVKRVGKDGHLWTPSQHSRICGDHFVTGSIEGVKNCAYAMAQLGSVQSGESQEEYIVPSPGDPSAPSTSGISSTSDGSPFFVSDVRSLADAPPVKVKLEVIEEPMGDIEISPHHLPPSAASASLTTPAYSSALETTTKERSLVHSAQAHPVLPSATLGLFSASHVSTQQQQHMQYNCPRTTTAPAASSEDTAPLGTSTRTAKPLRESPALAEHKMNLEIQLLQINKRKAEAELKRLEADERKIVSKMLLIAEEMKRCDDERKKLRAQTEFFLHEKMRSQEELRKNAAITEHHLEEKRKAAASADLLIAQKKTEVLRQRMLLLELRKMRQDHKPRQHSNTIEQHSSSMEQ